MTSLPADIPHVANDGLRLDQLLDNGPQDDEAVIDTDHYIPETRKLFKSDPYFSLLPFTPNIFRQPIPENS